MDDGEERMSQAEFETARTRLRQSVYLSAAIDVAVAVVMVVIDIPIAAVILLAFAIIGTPLVLAGLDRSWRNRGYDVP